MSREGGCPLFTESYPVPTHPAYVELAPIGISYVLSGVQYRGMCHSAPVCTCVVVPPTNGRSSSPS